MVVLYIVACVFCAYFLCFDSYICFDCMCVCLSICWLCLLQVPCVNRRCRFMWVGESVASSQLCVFIRFFGHETVLFYRV